MQDQARTLSGGQQQRLRLARALLAEPEILVLVDPTSSVDAHTEARIAEGLLTARAGRSTVLFTTSPLLLRGADEVVLLQGGLVAAVGVHRRAAMPTDATHREKWRLGMNMIDEVLDWGVTPPLSSGKVSKTAARPTSWV